MRDYYEVLDVDPKASPACIRAAYRSLAKKYHPDCNPGDPDATARLQEINAAYEVLKNPARRNYYDDTRYARERARQAEAERQRRQSQPPPPPPRPSYRPPQPEPESRGWRPWQVAAASIVVIIVAADLRETVEAPIRRAAMEKAYEEQRIRDEEQRVKAAALAEIERAEKARIAEEQRVIYEAKRAAFEAMLEKALGIPAGSPPCSARLFEGVPCTQLYGDGFEAVVSLGERPSDRLDFKESAVVRISAGEWKLSIKRRHWVYTSQPWQMTLGKFAELDPVVSKASKRVLEHFGFGPGLYDQCEHRSGLSFGYTSKTYSCVNEPAYQSKPPTFEFIVTFKSPATQVTANETDRGRTSP